MKSFHPKPNKRQGWPALLAVAVGLLLPLGYQMLHRGELATGAAPVVTLAPLQSAVPVNEVVPPASPPVVPNVEVPTT